MKAVDYYFSPMSPWTYLGHSRFADIAKRHGATINVKPVDFGKIFPVSGGVPVAKRAPQRQAYRFVELKRWQKFLGVPLVLEPKFFPYETSLAARVIIAADDAKCRQRDAPDRRHPQGMLGGKPEHGG